MSLDLYGIHPVCEALKKRPQAFRRVFLARQKHEASCRLIADLAAQAGVPVSREPAEALTRRVRSEHHQGVVAEVAAFETLDLPALLSWTRRTGPALLLVLDSVQDPQNFGALLRSAVCSGVQGVLFPKDRSARLAGAVARASAGAIEHVLLCRVVNIAAALEELKQQNIWTAGLSTDADTSIYDFDFTADCALVIGNEEKGIRPLVGKKCDVRLSIPMQGGFDSLNASAAGAVAMFEAMRQRKRG